MASNTEIIDNINRRVAITKADIYQLAAAFGISTRTGQNRQEREFIDVRIDVGRRLGNPSMIFSDGA